MYGIGIDIGTGSVKAVASDKFGNVLAACAVYLTTRETPHGGSTQDAKAVLAATLESVQQLLQKMNGAPSLGFICFSAAMHSLLAIDKNGAPLTEAMLWSDTRSLATQQQLELQTNPTDLYRATGLPLHPMTPLCKIAWLRENEPEIFSQAAKFISLKEFVFHAFTGEYVVDYSIASATGLFNIHSFQWHLPALQLAGIDADQLSLPVPILTKYPLNNKLLEVSALLKHCASVVGSSDGALATIGSGATAKGTLALTVGTSGAVRAISASPWQDETNRLFSYVIDKEQYLIGGATNNGGLVVDWFDGWFSENQNKTSLFEDALQLPVDKDGIICLPYFAGERAPVWDAAAKGVFTGVQIRHTKTDFMRAIIEGIAFSLFQIASPLMTQQGTHTIMASGGFAKSERWLQLLADVFNRKIIVSDESDASAIGAIIMGFEAMEIDSIKPIATTNSKHFEPVQENVDYYQNRYSIFRELYALHAKYFHTLNTNTL